MSDFDFDAFGDTDNDVDFSDVVDLDPIVVPPFTGQLTAEQVEDYTAHCLKAERHQMVTFRSVRS
jgi:hypothetical protein